MEGVMNLLYHQVFYLPYLRCALFAFPSNLQLLLMILLCVVALAVGITLFDFFFLRLILDIAVPPKDACSFSLAFLKGSV